MPAPTSKSPEEREFVVDSGASTHMLSKKDLSSVSWRLCGDPGTYNGGNGQWESANKRGSTRNVYDLDLFVTVQLLEDTPAVLSLG